MEKVQILLSTFNGEKYLEKQLDSILNQTYSNFTLLIRDDGSTDSTMDLLNRYAKLDPRISYYQGENKGVKGSFFDLVKKVDDTADFYSFSDQDDVWKPDKLEVAVIKLKEMNQNIPLLYCGKTTLVDHELNPIEYTIRTSKIKPGFGNALVENISTGCTSVVNRTLLLLVREHIPEFTVMHDWWFYLSASAFGDVIYDEMSYIDYRQHADNMIGTRSNYYDEFKKRFRNYRVNRGQVRRQAQEFDRLYQIDMEKKQLLTYVMNAKKNFRFRLIILFGKKIYRQRTLDNIIFKLLFLFGKI